MTIRLARSRAIEGQAVTTLLDGQDAGYRLSPDIGEAIAAIAVIVGEIDRLGGRLQRLDLGLDRGARARAVDKVVSAAVAGTVAVDPRADIEEAREEKWGLREDLRLQREAHHRLSMKKGRWSSRVVDG
jgi:hypothetical protein